MENSVMALSRENFKYIIVGCVIVIVGFILMSGGGTEDPTQFNEEELFSFRRITLAPFLVMLGYGCISVQMLLVVIGFVLYDLEGYGFGLIWF
jgi:hypothetical protein